MIVALEIDRSIDLSMFSGFLMESGIWHRINEVGALQQLTVETEAAQSQVVDLYTRYAAGEFTLQRQAPLDDKPVVGRNTFLQQALATPVVITLILVNILLFPVTMGADVGEFNAWFHNMSFINFEVIGSQLYFSDLSYGFERGEYWRLLTPMFLHFGWMHLVFNSLWVWEIGKRIELENGKVMLLLVVVISSLASNLGQYWLTGPGIFGGMSGVVYGFLGFSLLWSVILPERDLGLQKGIYIFMLAFLALGFTGAIDLLGMGSLANGAHLGGFVAGVLVALGATTLTKFANN